VQAVVTTSAQQAGLYLSTNGAIDLGGATGSSFTIEISGALGSREFQFGSGTTLADVNTAINTFTNVTGVAATVSGNGIKLNSSDYGSKDFVSVKVVKAAGITGTGIGIFQLNATDFNTADSSSQTAFASAGNGVRDNGQDIVATINGIQATSDGRKASINTDFLNVDITFSDAAASNSAQTVGAVNAFTINDGGADFQLSGHVDTAGKVSLGIADTSTRKLGNSTVGYLSDLGSGKGFNVQTGDLVGAQAAISEAIKQVSTTRGRLGALQKNTIGATLQSLGVSLENTSAAESAIRDTDFAAETASLSRNQILVSAATNILALANSQPQSVLQLLR
jgi:flagellin